MPAEQLGGSLLWDVVRASGFTALGLLVLAASLGFAVRRGWWDEVLGRRAVLDLHRFAWWCAAVALAVHLGSLLVDGYVRFTVWDLLIPFRAPYAPLGTAAGVLALYALLATVGAAWARRRLGYPRWLRLHRLSHLALALAAAHALLAGTDRWTALGVYLALLAAGMAWYGRVEGGRLDP